MSTNRPTDRSRRAFLGQLAALTAAWLAPTGPLAGEAARHARPIPGSGERIPAVGMGTWLTFDVHDDAAALAVRARILERFFARGGGLIDSSPMYGSAQAVLGDCLGRLDDTSGLFAATKVWTPGRWLGVRQMENSARLWDLPRFDLLQVHNLLDWETHLETLLQWKTEGRVRYVGVTTSHGRRHDELLAVMAREPIDFVQFTYNIDDREAERRLLPLAAERGIAVIANRPFQGGNLFDRVGDAPLPGWAVEIDCANWAQVFLKFIISHPTVTWAIPATSRVDHMEQNMGALTGALPDPTLRGRMARDFAALG
ncbi:MAG: aldo/keto reductase [Gammaproteobacteria bacterium]